jgi:hypothetical protein
METRCSGFQISIMRSSHYGPEFLFVHMQILRAPSFATLFHYTFTLIPDLPMNMHVDLAFLTANLLSQNAGALSLVVSELLNLVHSL